MKFEAQHDMDNKKHLLLVKWEQPAPDFTAFQRKIY